MIKSSSVKQNALVAIEKDEIFEFLTGRKGYDLPATDVQVNVPTGWAIITPSGIYGIFSDGLQM